MAGAATPPLAAALLAVPAAPACSRARAATSSSTASRPSSSPTTTPTSCLTGSTRTSDAPNLGHPAAPSHPPTVSTMKLAVEVADTAELSAKDGTASCNAFVEVEFDGQRQRTATRPDDLSRSNEAPSTPATARLSALTVGVHRPTAASTTNAPASRLPRGVRCSDSIARSPDEAIMHRYPLDKRGLFSRVSGDIALRLYLAANARDDDRVAQDHAAPSVDTAVMPANCNLPGRCCATWTREDGRTSSPWRRQSFVASKRRRPMGRVATTHASSAPFRPRQAAATSLGATRSTPWRRLPLRRGRRWSCRSPRDLPRHRLPARSTSRSAAESGGAAGPAIGCGEPADRLSDLPDALLHHIMSFLKAWEMVGTCRLSRRWRNLWASAPCIDVRVGRHDNPPEEFAKFVHRLLRSRDALAPLDTLRARSVGEDDFYETYNNGNVKGWIRTAIKRKARVIQLNGHLHKYFTLDHIDFASCHLRILKLSYVKLDDKVVKQLSSQCPLEELELKSCVVGVSDILSFSLKSLTMVKCKLTMNLLVDAPNLIFFRCIKPEKWVPVFKNSVSLIGGSIMLDDSLLSREFQKYHEDEDEDEFPQTSDEDDDIDNTNGQCNGNSAAAAAEGFLDSILFGSFSDYCDDYSDDFYDGYSDDIKDDYDYGSDINSDDGTYEYSEIANGSEDKYFGNCYDGFEFSKGGKISGYSKNHGFNDYETLGGQNILCSLSNARSIELLGHSGEVVLRRESVSCPTFNNLKTLSLGEWCISRGADFDILVRLLQHTPYLENLFLQLEMNFDIQNALARCKPNGGSFACKHLRMVKIKCTKDDPRVHMLAQLFKANDIPLEKICVRRSGSFNLRMLKLNREINIAEMRASR
ncbi:hypothetical protein ZWY2020_041527 [Hordeum vulgare]|nr:hypothetical protein ZWY2020_041527 [Hordeum vulgare]